MLEPACRQRQGSRSMRNKIPILNFTLRVPQGDISFVKMTGISCHAEALEA